MNRVLLKIVICMLLPIHLVISMDYYVTSLSEMNASMPLLNPGDTITMSSGIWRDQVINFSGNGTESSPILLRAETRGEVIITGINSRLNLYGSYLVVDGLYFLGGYQTYEDNHLINTSSGSHHCRFTNIAVVDYNPPNWGLYYKWMQLNGQYHRLDHSYFSGKNHRDAMIKVVIPANQPSFTRLDHNYFGDVPLGMTGNNWETLRIQGGDIAYGQVVIEDNYFYRCDGEIEIISLKAGDNDIRRNTFYESIGTVTCRKNEGNRIYDNFFIGNQRWGTAGVRMYSKDHIVYNNYFENLNGEKGAIALMYAQPDEDQVENPEVENITVAFNTMIECEPNISVGIMYSVASNRIVPPRNSIIANNLCYKTSGIMTSLGAGVEGITYIGNLFYGTDLGIDDSSGIDFSDPQLAFSDDLWRLTTESPAIGAAEGDFEFVNHDVDGQDRSDGAKDIGADEYSDTAILNRPLLREDVGPEWIWNENLALAVFVTTAGTGSGTVIMDPPGGIYAPGTELDLIAVPDEGHHFESWFGDVSGSDDTISIIVTQNMEIGASFSAPVMYTISIWNSSGTISGSVDLNPASLSYPPGTIVTVTALPAAGYEFSHWGGDLNGSNSNPDTLLMDDNKAIMVNFHVTTSISDENATLPESYALGQNYPNPFNPSTVIKYDLIKSGVTRINIYDSSGRLMAQLLNQVMDAGHYKLEFGGSDLPSGVYIYTLESDNFLKTRKMILLR
jgi:poly(beta-D-mannuronate) lyase